MSTVGRILVGPPRPYTPSPAPETLPYPQSMTVPGLLDPTKYRRSYDALQANEPMNALLILFDENLPVPFSEAPSYTQLKSDTAAEQANNDRRTW